jgi:hypothetical protein
MEKYFREESVLSGGFILMFGIKPRSSMDVLLPT